MSVHLRLFAGARESAGRAVEEYDAHSVPTLALLLDEARARHGADFAAVLATSRVWINGEEPIDGAMSQLADGDEVAVLPPVSGG